jgi:hypothetical protein
MELERRLWTGNPQHKTRKTSRESALHKAKDWEDYEDSKPDYSDHHGPQQSGLILSGEELERARSPSKSKETAGRGANQVRSPRRRMRDR